MESLHYDIKFKFPSSLGVGERKSKFIDEKSDLYAFLKRVRTRISRKLQGSEFEVGPQRMDFHIELINEGDSSNVMSSRVKNMQEKKVDPNACYIYKKALCLATPNADNCRKTHITIAFCKNEISEHVRLEMMEIILEEVRFSIAK